MPTYALTLRWEGDTSDYASYSRRYRVAIEGKPELVGSADPRFRGEAELWNPEDLLMAAVAGCHMLSYLALCARAGIRVVSYEDAAEGRLVFEGGGGQFEEIVLRPRVVIASGDRGQAIALHARAGELCFIARSCNFPIRHEPVVDDQ